MLSGKFLHTNHQGESTISTTQEKSLKPTHDAEQHNFRPLDDRAIGISGMAAKLTSNPNTEPPTKKYGDDRKGEDLF